MKKSALTTAAYAFAFAAVLFATCIGFYACTNAKANTVTVNGIEIPALLPRTGELAKAAEWDKTQAKAQELTAKIVASPADVKPRLQLATIFMSEARVTGNSYYHQAALKTLEGVLGIDNKNFEATTYKASIAMSLHQFATAKDVAQKALTINPANAYVYGVLVDANVELGDYATAIAMSDKMQTLKPSLESYSRASYLREINGDYNGAIEAMQLAVKAGLSGSESDEWARCALADLYLNTGKVADAEQTYLAALTARPNFPNAEIGLAKVEKTKKNYDAAIKHVENAIRIVSEAGYVSQLGELYALKGDKTKAKQIADDVVTLLEQAEKDQASNEVVMKHNANRELANAYLAAGNYDKALTHAQADLALRPNNIDANELMAWVLYTKGDAAAAKPYLQKALATNSKNPRLLERASQINQ